MEDKEMEFSLSVEQVKKFKEWRKNIHIELNFEL